MSTLVLVGGAVVVIGGAAALYAYNRRNRGEVYMYGRDNGGGSVFSKVAGCGQKAKSVLSDCL